jgi:hypothetical protein
MPNPLRAAAAVAYATLAVTALTRVYDPLPDLPIALGVAALALPSRGLGLAVARPWAPAVPLVLAAAFAVRGEDVGNAFSTRLESLDVLALGVGAGVLTLVGVLAATSPRPRLAVLRHWGARVAGGALVALATLPLAWAGSRHVSPEDASPGEPLPVAVTGSIGGVGLGADPATVMRTFGRTSASTTASIAPLGESFARIAAPPVIETPGESHEVLRYAGASFLLSDGLVYAVVVTAEDAETAEGVGVGDNLSVARDAYDGLRCTTEVGEHRRTFPRCAGRVAPDVWASFGDDPIRSITLATTEL